jgi:hypothetical protein
LSWLYSIKDEIGHSLFPFFEEYIKGNRVVPEDKTLDHRPGGKRKDAQGQHIDHQLPGVHLFDMAQFHFPEDLSKNLFRIDPGGFDQLDDPLRVSVQLVQDELRDLGKFKQCGDVCIDESPDHFFEGHIRHEYLDQVWGHLAESLDENGFEEPVLASVIIMKKRLVDACLAGDHLHGGAIEPVLQEDFPGGIEDEHFRFFMIYIHLDQKV